MPFKVDTYERQLPLEIIEDRLGDRHFNKGRGEKGEGEGEGEEEEEMESKGDTTMRMKMKMALDQAEDDM